MNMNNWKKFICAAGLIAMPYVLFAQQPGIPCDGSETDPDIDCPIDGGVVALMAAGAFFGGKKLLRKSDQRPS